MPSPRKDQDFKVPQGDTRTLELTVYADDSDSATVDITGATIKWEWETYTDDSLDAVTKSTGSGITITDAANGVFQVTLTSSDTEKDPGWYKHEAQMEDAGGDKVTIAQGTGKVTSDIVD